MTQLNINPQHQQQIVAWCKSIGIDPHCIPMQPRSLVVSPLNEGELEVRYTYYQGEYKDGRFVPVVATDKTLRPVHQNTRIDKAPPGFTRCYRHVLEWDAYVYMRLRNAQPCLQK